MKRLVYVLTVGMVIALAGGVRATQILFTDFEGFKTGASIENQNGWSSDNPGWDEEIVNASGNTVWRVSNAVASGTFGDMPFAPRLGGIPTNTVTNPTNDSPGAFAGESSTGTSLDRFHSMFSFRSATGGPQPGARITVSADNGEGGRQSFISLEDTGSGINVGTFDVNTGGNFIGTLGCVLGVDVPCPAIVIASNLSYKKWHTTSVEIRFKDGPSNDRVKYFVNGAHVHTGPSWEQFYRSDGQAMVLDILNPTGAVIASTLPAVGPAVVTVPVAAAGAYAVRVRNLGLTNSASRVTLIRSVRR